LIQKTQKKFTVELLFFCSLAAVLIKIAVVTCLSPALEEDTRVLLAWAQNMLKGNRAPILEEFYSSLDAFRYGLG
jgi:hypothetical protein